MKFGQWRRMIVKFAPKVLGPVFVLFCLAYFSLWMNTFYSFSHDTQDLRKERPWYFEGGSVRPNSEENSYLKIWPNEEEGDRITNQLMFAPKGEALEKKKIFLERLQTGKSREKLARIFDGCPVSDCRMVDNVSDADAVIFENFVTRIREKSSWNQIWILHSLENPIYSGKVIQETSVNWTASYRLNSDLVTPYDKWVYYDETKKSGVSDKNYAAGKTKKVAWFVSNCHSQNKRMEYAKELGEYIQVDIYGECGDKTCPKKRHQECRQMLSTDYKFYLAFENANCRDYITEKFFWNGLRLDVIPIVMGPPKEDYEKVAPLGSFIHVEDFPTPKDLSRYLLFLDENDEAYNMYFRWKRTGEFINTYFLCRLCGLLHAQRPNYYYHHIMSWWRNSGTCTKKFWNKTNERTILTALAQN